MSVIVVGLILFISLFERSKLSRILFLSLAAFIVLRYFIWRTFTTLSFHDPLSFSFAIVLYVAELYGLAIFFLGAFANVNPHRREPAPLPENEEELPTVDVFVPSYNEPKDVLETTLLAALQMDYPTDRFSVHLLDDGGTDQKCEQSDEIARREAIERRTELQDLCESIGAKYQTRSRNESAKAGNINAAMQHTHADLILILDADHVPTRDFLQNTVGRFLVDPGLFMVQTPHFAVDPDPVERNLKTFHHMPSEQEMFYSGVQFGLDHWNASSFCGSAALLRRSCLEEIGGIAGKTITEDAETAVELHARGYSSEYIGIPMIAGLSPATVQSFVTQRSRWAQGMLQIFMLSNPLMKRGLTLPQRLCYMNSCMFWFFPLVRLIFTLAPCAFLIFGLKIYDANWQSFLTFALPYVVAVLATSNFLYGKLRWPFISDLYEMVQAVHLIPPVLQALLNPTSGVFKVTPKKESLEKDFISSVGWAVQALFLLNLATLGMGIWRLVAMPDDLYPTAITMFWSGLNTVILMGALGAITERRKDREEAVVAVSYPVSIEGFGDSVEGEVVEMDNKGCRINVPFSSRFRSPEGTRGSLVIDSPRHGKTRLNVEWIGREKESRSLEFEFRPQSVAEKGVRVDLIFGDSQRWVDFQASRQRRRNLLLGMFSFASLAVQGLTRHLVVLFRELSQEEPDMVRRPAPNPFRSQEPSRSGEFALQHHQIALPFEGQPQPGSQANTSV